MPQINDLKTSLFAERDTLQEVQEYIEKFPNADKMVLYTVMGITLNTVIKNIQDGVFDDVKYTPKGDNEHADD